MWTICKFQLQVSKNSRTLQGQRPKNWDCPSKIRTLATMYTVLEYYILCMCVHVQFMCAHRLKCTNQHYWFLSTQFHAENNVILISNLQYFCILDFPSFFTALCLMLILLTERSMQLIQVLMMIPLSVFLKSCS